MATRLNKSKLIGWLIAVYIPLAAGIGFIVAGYLFFLFNKRMPPHFDALLFWRCWTTYSGDPKLYKKLVGAAAVAATIVYFVPLVAYGAAVNKKRSLHGDARFANAGELAKAGLDAYKGIIVGKHRNRYLVQGGQTFVLLAAPTRSGKGVSVVIPNLLNWPDSLICLDMKYENFLFTSGFRQRSGQLVYLFAPFSETGETHRWNPLGFVRQDSPFIIDDINSVGYDLYPVTGDAKADFWLGLARDLFLGVCLFIAETPALPFTLGEVLRQGTGAGKSTKDHFRALIDARVKSATPLSASCCQALERFCAAADSAQTGGSIRATFTEPLATFASPLVDAATSACDFDIAQIRRQRMSIYLGVPANKLAQSSLLMNMFFAQAINLNTRELPQTDSTLKYQCLLLPDEFTALGRINIIAKSVGYIAGFGLRLLPIVQSVAQIRSVYRDDTDTLLTNHDTKIVFAPSEQKEAEEYSKMLGDFTMSVRSVGGSSPTGFSTKGGGSTSHNIAQLRRELMKPQELREMSADRCIVFIRGFKPILCNKITYYDDPVFIDRLKSVSPTLAALGKSLPTQRQLETAAFVTRDLCSFVPSRAIATPTNNIQLTLPDEEQCLGQEPDLSVLRSGELLLPALDDQQNPSEASLNNLIDDFFNQLDWIPDGEHHLVADEAFEIDLAVLD
jgi:type IV secretion system protein VirD4